MDIDINNEMKEIDMDEKENNNNNRNNNYNDEQSHDDHMGNHNESEDISASYFKSEVKLETSPRDKSSFPLNSLILNQLNYDVVTKKGILCKAKTETIHILKEIDLNLKIGSFNAILGPSGSGKTTLLNFMSLRVVANSKPQGEYLVNGKDAYSTKSFRRAISYVLQEDIFIPHLTVRETLMYAAKLKLPATMTEEDKIKKVDEIINRLGLKRCENTYVGEPGITKGISGGEKKRLSIGVELITSPAIMFVDEPTTGLDSVLAYEVIKILKDIVVNDGVTVVATIHQPSSEVFRFFDDILVMKAGKIITYVESKKVIDVFREKGLDCDELENPAEFLLRTCMDRQNQYADQLNELMNTYNTNAKLQIEKEKKRMNLTNNKINKRIKSKVSFSFMEKGKDLEEDNLEIEYKKTRPNIFYMFKALLSRVYLSNFRNPQGMMTSIFLAVFFSLMVGLIFLRIGGKSQKSIQDRLGAIFFILINLGMGSIQGLLTTFAIERPVFLKEYMGNQYGVTSYFFSKVLVLIPLALLSPLIYMVIAYFMIGFQAQAANFFIYVAIIIFICLIMNGCGMAIAAFSKTVQIALALTPVILLPMIILCGYFLNKDSIPKYLIWIHYISPFKYGYELLLSQEFTGLTFVCKASELVNGTVCATTNGQQVLASYGLAHVNKAFNWGMLVCLSVCSIILAYGILLYKSINYKRNGVL
eukprot:TRINITY_DN1598_c0_g2_i1.p1 TRINITY_DN1598_c0_g2~~TRINITY_DN1598_c0_g2_i1.p1  ORF type:complete len:702 (+),score=193.99 TRINITY_DN1598_c0_g2_i1:254-2359(+)